MSRKKRYIDLTGNNEDQVKAEAAYGPLKNMGRIYKKVEAKTEGQARYIDTVNHNSIILCDGPPGTGKTYIAIGLAVEALRREQVGRIVLSRPILEACGEELGALPGSVEERLHPYLKPLYDSLADFASKQEIATWMKDGQIEILPSAYMRGCTLKHAFVVIDECQNLTFAQIKLILTRMGEESVFCLNGDQKQSDLPHYKSGAFEIFMKILSGLNFIGICHLEKSDIVRSKFLIPIIDRIEKYEEEEKLDRLNTPRGYIR